MKKMKKMCCFGAWHELCAIYHHQREIYWQIEVHNIRNWLWYTRCNHWYSPSYWQEQILHLGKGYVDNKLNRFCKNIILQFTTFRLRTMLYWTGNQSKKAKVKLDLTKKRYTTHIDDASFVKNYSFVNFVLVNIKCRLKGVLLMDTVFSLC